MNTGLRQAKYIVNGYSRKTNFMFGSAVAKINEKPEFGATMKHSSLLFLLALAALLLWQCSKNTSEPPLPAGPDTTSHSFTWTLDTIGTRSSYLLDVAIVNENDIWAVGEIHTAETDTVDSLGNWVPPYNAVHWNGSEWEFQRIFVNFRGQPTWVALQGVFALKDGNVIFSSGLPYLPEANGWKLYHLWDMGVLDDEDGSVYRIWGTSLSNLYFAGSKGTIVHYNGSSWQKLDSGTEATIQDIWGAQDPISNEYYILCAVANTTSSGDRKIVRIFNNGTVDTLNWKPERRALSIWFNEPNTIFASGDGVFFRHQQEPWQLDETLPSYTKERIRGTDINDIFVVGHFGLVGHFNGLNWRHYPEVAAALYYSCSYKNQTMAAVGERNARGVILRMQR